MKIKYRIQLFNYIFIFAEYTFAQQSVLTSSRLFVAQDGGRLAAIIFM
jgi:hypothetical protein